MSYKITVLTPTHIGNGQKNARFLYKGKGQWLYRYDISDVLANLSQHIPAHQLLNLDLSSNRKSDWLQIITKNVDYSDLSPLYKVKNENDYDSKDISEQIKNLNVPMIPGSSLKGVMMNAICYALIKRHLDRCNELMERERIRSENELLTNIYGSSYSTWMNKISSCLIFRDISFSKEDLLLCKGTRLNMQTNKGAAFTNYECIAPGACFEGEMFVIDSYTKPFLSRLPSDLTYYLDEDHLLEALRDYFSDVSAEDMEYFEQHEYDFEVYADELYDFIMPKQGALIRIGNSTNYFYKSIALLFKENAPELYSNKFHLFSPAPLGKRNSPKPHTIPKTRTIFTSGEIDYLPGMIKIEKCEYR